MGVVAKRFEVYLIELDPTRGSEIRKTRPCLVISPDEVNDNLTIVIVAPMTTKGKNYPCRITCVFQGKRGRIVLDKMRAVDESRLVKRLGTVSPKTQSEVC